MGKTSNPLKYFNDQAEARSKNMGKALKRFQFNNAQVKPEPSKDQPKDLGIGTSIDTKAGELSVSGSTQFDPNKFKFTDPNVMAALQSKNGDGYLMVNTDPTNLRDTQVGASKTFTVGKNKDLKIKLTGNFDFNKGTGSGNATQMQNSARPLSGNQGRTAAVTGTPMERKGGPTRKKKK